MTGSIREGDFFADRYRILKHLGDGTSGQTFEARDSLRREKVILRILYPDLIADAGGWNGILALLKCLTQINDPQVMRVYDFNRWHDHVFLICEFLEGQSIRDRIQDKSHPVDAATLDAWMLDLLRVLARNTDFSSHQGLKPSNIWITPDERVKLADYGFGGLTTDEKRRAMATLQGNALYLAPEGFSHRNEDPFKQDQFAAGRVMEDLASFWQKENPDKSNSPSSSGLQELVQKLQAPRPESRFANPNKLLTAISNAQPTRFSVPRWLSDSVRKAPRGIIWALGVSSVIGFASLLGSWRPNVGEKSVPIDTSHLMAQWSELNRDRMDLLKTLLKSPHGAVAGTIEELNPIHDDEWMRRMGAFETNQLKLSRQQREFELEQLNDALSQRQARLQLARKAWLEVATLEDRQATFAALQETSSTLLSNPPPKLAPVVKQTLEQLSRKLYGTAGNTLRRAISDSDSYLESLVTQQEANTDLAQENWHQTVKSAGFATVDFAPSILEQVNEAKRARNLSEIARAVELYESIRARYQAWTEEVKAVREPSPAHWVNHLGMRFVSQLGMRISVWETRVIDFAAYVAASGADHRFMWRRNAESPKSGPTHPVTNVNYFDAINFCEWLTREEHSRGLLPDGWAYRLPTDSEWSQMVGLEEPSQASPTIHHLKNQNHWPWGKLRKRTPSSGNYYTPPGASERNRFHGADPFEQTAPVGQFPPSPIGLFDLGGNVWEITMDPMELESTPNPQTWRAHRGGGWKTISLEVMLSSFRLSRRQGREDVGFRCVLAPVEGTDSPHNALGSEKSILPGGPQ